jgi:hypothetical protein
MGPQFTLAPIAVGLGYPILVRVDVYQYPKDPSNIRWIGNNALWRRYTDWGIAGTNGCLCWPGWRIPLFPSDPGFTSRLPKPFNRGAN